MIEEPQYDQSPPIASEKLEMPEARKTFFFDLRDNNFGTFVKIKQRSPLGKQSIHIPISYLSEFIDCLEKLEEAAE